MARENLLTQEGFETLLSWLDRNRDIAGQKYEKIRKRLIWIFTCRGCFEAEELADETINRVTFKIPQIAANYVGEPTLYFYGVADKIHLEWLRKQKKIKIEEIPPPENKNESEYECLESCLAGLPKEQRELAIGYYSEEKSAKIQRRKKMAESLGIGVGALQVKMHRIRAGLLKCVEKCLRKKEV